MKTLEVERWLRAIPWADGSKAKIKCVMSALFSHAVRWEFCSHNPISSGIPVGSGGERGPSVGVRVSAKRRKSPLVLSAEQVAKGLGELQFRDQLLVFLDGALGTRRGELGGLRWQDCDFLWQDRLLDPNGPRLVFEGLCKLLKKLAGTTRLELATSAVTEPMDAVTY